MTSQNRILMNCNFRVGLPGCELRASKIRSIEQAIELEPVREGGRNDSVRMLVKPPAEPKKLIIERGCCSFPESLAVRAMLGIPQNVPLTIAIFDRTNRIIRRVYTAENWMLVKWQLSDLDAGDGGVLLETAEVAYERLRELSV